MGLRIHHLPYSLPLYIMVYIRINNNIINNNTTNINKSAIYEHIHIDNNTSALSLSLYIYTRIYIYIYVCVYIYIYIYMYTPLFCHDSNITARCVGRIESWRWRCIRTSRKTRTRWSCYWDPRWLQQSGDLKTAPIDGPFIGNIWKK